MSEPQPPHADEVEAGPPPPASGEDRKAAAALSALEGGGGPGADDDAPTTKSAADQAALGAAMSRLEMLDQGTAAGKAAGTGAGGADQAKKKEEAERKRKIKVDAGDVAIVVEHLELSKPKATELLRNHEGNIDRALAAYVVSSA